MTDLTQTARSRVFDNEQDAAEAADNGPNTGGKSYLTQTDRPDRSSYLDLLTPAGEVDHAAVCRMARQAAERDQAAKLRGGFRPVPFKDLYAMHMRRLTSMAEVRCECESLRRVRHECEAIRRGETIR